MHTTFPEAVWNFDLNWLLYNISRSYDDILGVYFLYGLSVDWQKIRRYRQTTKDVA